jgi:hypothetical protein
MPSFHEEYHEKCRLEQQQRQEQSRKQQEELREEAHKKQLILAERFRFLQEASPEEQKLFLRKEQVHAEALRRIAQQNAEIEKAKFEEEVLAEIARIESLM